MWHSLEPAKCLSRYVDVPIILKPTGTWIYAYKILNLLKTNLQVHAAAIQPADAKVAKIAILKMEYPAVLGGPVAGTVEALGKGVSKVVIGAHVTSGTKVLVHKKEKYGGLQRFAVVDESEIVEVSLCQSKRKRSTRQE